MNDGVELPVRTRIYRGHALRGEHWDQFNPRDDDIIIASAFKAGTTWMQTIVANLLFQDTPIPAPVMELSPWIDRYRYGRDIADTIDTIDRQQHRRFLKTHLPLDGLRFFACTKYILLARDGRDSFMSLWNHHNNYSEKALDGFRKTAIEIGVPWPETATDIHHFCHDWLTRSFFPWESEGYPYWSMFHNLATWWEYRHLPNILFVHYNDLLANPRAAIERVADFLDVKVGESAWAGILTAVSIKEMRANAANIMGSLEDGFRGGGQTFINKGTNGRWREVLNDAELELYEAAVDRNLSADAAHWLAHGGPV